MSFLHLSLLVSSSPQTSHTKSQDGHHCSDLRVFWCVAKTMRWSTNWHQYAKQRPTVCLHPFLSSVVQVHGFLYGTMPKSCLICKHQWPSASSRCGPVYNSSQPGSSLKISCRKRPPALFWDETGHRCWLFVHWLADFQSLACVTESCCLLCVCLVAGLFGHVRLPQKELVEESVDGVRTLHHDHVTSFLDDF